MCFLKDIQSNCYAKEQKSEKPKRDKDIKFYFITTYRKLLDCATVLRFFYPSPRKGILCIILRLEYHFVGAADYGVPRLLR